MPGPAKRERVRESTNQHELRDQEVLRANRELAAYFKGRRTEREARAALKTIKAFIRDRERADPKSLRPLPGRTAGPSGSLQTRGKIETSPQRARPTARRQVQEQAPDTRDGQDRSPA